MESMTSLRYIILTSIFFIMIVVIMDLTMITNYFSINQVHGNPFLVNNTSIYATWMEGIKQPNSETMDTNNDYYFHWRRNNNHVLTSYDRFY